MRVLPLCFALAGASLTFANRAGPTCPGPLQDGVCLRDSEILEVHKGITDPARCCALCSAKPQCVAYNVNNDTTRESCYLRSTYKADAYAPGSPCKSAQLRPDTGACGGAQRFPKKVCLNGSPNLKPQSETDYTATDIECCALCANSTGCVGWTWGFDARDPANQGRHSCRLKSAIGGQQKVQNCTSGCTAPGCVPTAPPTPPPHPAPTPPPPTPIPAPTPPPKPAAGKQPHIIAILVE